MPLIKDVLNQLRHSEWFSALDHCSVIGKDHTSLLSTKIARDFKNKIIEIECVFSKISTDNVGNGQERIYNCIYL
jgi:hypothetical protein